MPDVIYCTAPWWSGIWHRFMVLRPAKVFANHFGYRIHFLWGISSGVSYYRFEELLSPVPGIHVINVSEQELIDLEKDSSTAKILRYRGQPLSVFRGGHCPNERMFAFDQFATQALEQMVPSHLRQVEHLCATPSAEIQQQAGDYIRAHRLHRRVGIRVRVTESPVERRKPHRLQRELDEAVRSIICLPWHAKVFVVTDSEYIQQMLASHFYDTKCLPKRFDYRDVGGQYVHRHDRAAMITFLKEVTCLMACCKIINLGGFLNESSVRAKIVEPPYSRALCAEAG